MWKTPWRRRSAGRGSWVGRSTTGGGHGGVPLSQFSWASIQSVEVLERSRAARFRPELRDVLLGYFGIRRGMQVLDVGCGPGTFTEYLAAAVAPGEVTGLDLDEEFAAYAQAKAATREGSHARYVVGDAYALPFEEASFDAVTSYTGIGVLTEPLKAVAEMVRVCRPGGSVSIAEGVSGPGGITFYGVDGTERPEPFPGARRLAELVRRLRSGRGDAIPGIGSAAWPRQALWALLASLGLEELQLNAWGHVIAPDDHRVGADLRGQLRAESFDELRQWVSWLLGGHGSSALSQEELQEILALGERRRLWAEDHPLWDWDGGLSIVASARKPDRPRGTRS